MLTQNRINSVLTLAAMAMAIVVLTTGSANARIIVEEQFIYEPPEANIDGQNSGIGFDGPWVSTISHGRIYWIRSPGLEFSTLPVAGNALSRYGSAGRAQAHRLLSSESKAALTRDGTTIWFGVLFQEPANQYRHGSFLFGTEAFATDGTPTLAAAGDGFGFTIQAAPDGSAQGTGTINALAFNGSTAPTVVQGTYTPDPITATSLIVGKINWKPDGTPDELFLFNVTDLSTEPPEGAAIASITNLDLDQSAFDRIAMWDSNNAITDEIRFGTTFANVMGRPGDPTTASNPNPANEGPDVPRDVVLSWAQGQFAAPTNGHKVYFGESFNEVNDATGGVAQDANSYTPPQRLGFSTTYYWRVDEVNAPPNSHIEFKGEVWSFTTEPIAYGVDGNNITATASSSDVGQGPENTVNRSGLDANDLHSTEMTDMWLSGEESAGQAWIEYEFDKVYKLHQMWVWNHNTAFEMWVGFGFKDVTVEYSTNGTDWTVLAGVTEFARGTGLPDYTHNTPVDFDGVVAKYVKITANSNWGAGVATQYGLSEVRFFYIPVRAREPKPGSGETDVALDDVVLSWRAGREAAEHNVYVNTKRQAVRNGTALVDTVTEASYGPLSLDLGQTYYWKINEVNMAETPNTWDGDIWSFATPDYFVVEDFEDYDDFCNRIFYKWTDGWGYSGDSACGVAPYDGNGSGSTIGYLDVPYAEQTITHDGSFQSMPFEYLNDGSTGKALYSETERAFDPPQDWTRKGVKALTLYFRGQPGSVGSFSYDAGTDIYTMTASGVDIWNVPDFAGAGAGNYHDEFHYAYRQLSGVGTVQARVLSVQNTNGWAKAGVMIRETLDANSVHAMMVVTPSQGVSFQRRTATGQGSAHTTQAGIQAPYWVRLTRSGNTFTAEHSADGATWEQIGTENIPMATTVYIGLALTSHNADATCEATFSDVTTTGTVTGQWQSQDIGIATNDAEQLYVALQDSTGTVEVVDHPDPNVVQLDTWQEWNIDLADFAPVDITRVKKMYIGVGNRNAPTLGGAGILYIDDIRLYPLRCTLSRRSADFARVDYVADCVVDYKELEVMAENWLAAALDMIPVTVPDAGFDDHVLNNAGDYIDVADALYTGAWESVSGDAWIDYRYWAEAGYPEDLPARSGNNKAYAYLDYIYQILDETFIEGETYTFSVWAGQPWVDSASGWRLYFTTEDHTNELATASGQAALDWEQISLSYTATAADAGKKIGIKMWGDEDVSFDDVTLFRSAEPPADPRPNLYEDKKIDFKDFAELAVWWLDEQRWP